MRPLGRRAWVFLATVAAAAGPAAAFERVDYPIKPISVTSFEGNFYLRGDILDSQQKSLGSNTREKQTLFEEGLEVNSSGYFYHPNMVEWTANLMPALTQEDIRINDDDRKTQGRLTNYNLSALFLKEKPVSGRVFASESQSLRDRDFARSMKFDEAREGGEIHSRGDFPVSFLAETISIRETSDLRDVSSDEKHYRATIADRRKEDWLTELTFDRRDKSETATYMPAGGGPATVQDLPDKKDEAILSHNWKFGPGPDKSSLTGRYRFLDETGAFMNKVYGGGEHLELIHSDTLRSFYDASYENNKTEEETDVTKTAEAGVTKRFYDSLELTFRLSDRDETTDTSGDNILRGAIEANYQKKTLLGTYYSSLVLDAQREELESSNGLVLIQRQPVLLPEDYSWLQLTHPNVVGSILVVDSVTELPYAEGVQYEVQTFGAFTQIRRKPFSPDPIPAGRTVLLTYTVQSAKSATIGRRGATWNNRLQLDKIPVSFYINTQDMDEWLVRGDDPGNINPQSGTLYGVEYDFKGFQVALEHENRDQVLSPPWRANRVRAGYRRNVSRDLDMSISGNAEKLQYLNASQFGLEPGRDHRDSIGGNVSMSARLNTRTVLRLGSDYQKTKGQENRSLWRNTAGLTWQYGKMDFSLEARYDVLSQEETTGDSVSLMFYLKRKF